MTKVTLDDLANLTNETSAVNTINENNDRVVAAIDNTLSRDGSTPNQMEANLDMNSNRILNLPAAVSSGEPIRKAEFDLITSPDLPDTIFNAIAALSIPTSLTGQAGNFLRVNSAETAYEFVDLPVVSYDNVAAIKALSATGYDTNVLVQIKGDEDTFEVLSGNASTNGYSVTNDAVVFQNTAATLTFVRRKFYRHNIIEFAWWNTNPASDCATNLQAALNVAESKATSSRFVTVRVPGSYTISTAVLLPNNVTLDGLGIGSFTVGAAMSLTASVFAEKSTQTSNTRNAENIIVRGITIDGAARAYPEWLTHPGTGAAITDPQNDYSSPGTLNAGLYPGGINDVVAANRRNGAAVTTDGYLIKIQNCNRPIVENCRFLNHQSFGVGIIGCLYGVARNNYFSNMGRISYQSPAIICTDFGSAWIITNITKANPAVITVVTDTTLSNGATIRLRNNTWGSFASSFTASTVSTTSITTNVDSSAFSGTFLYNGRQLLTTDAYIPSLNNIVEDNFFIDLDRIAIQVGGENNIVRNNTIRNGKEGGIFAFRALGAIIDHNYIEGITMSDIVAGGIELNYCTDTEVRYNRINRVVGRGISAIGAYSCNIDNNRIHSASLTGPSTTYPYGPFSERYAFNIGSAIVAGTTVASVDRTPVVLSSVNTMTATGSVKDNVISDDRIATLTDNGMFFTKAGTAGDESVNTLTVSGNDFSRWTPVEATVNRTAIIDWTTGVLCNQTCFVFNNKRTVTEDPVRLVDVQYNSGTTGNQTINCDFPARSIRVTCWDINDTYPTSYSISVVHKTSNAASDEGNSIARVIWQAWNGTADFVNAATSVLGRLTDTAGTQTFNATFVGWTDKGVTINISTNTVGAYVRVEFYP